MTRHSVQRFRAAVLRMYLRIAVFITLPLSVMFVALDMTPDHGAFAFLFSLYALWLQWRLRHLGEESLRYAGWFVLAVLGLMLYGVWVSNAALRQEGWMMIFPIVFAPIVATRERIVWAIAGTVSIVAVMLLRPETPTAISTLVYVIAFLTLSFITLMLVQHNEQNIERLAHLSIIDPLTRVYNRGFMKDVLVSEINRCRRNCQPLMVVMLDIDHFKKLNDDYGHMVGDGVLEQVASALKHAAQRAGDYVFRYGGEEFCILASGVTVEEASLFADKLRGCVKALGVENRNTPLGRLTASVGYWWVADTGEVTPSMLLLNADNALYRAKDAGRDCTVDFADVERAEGLQSGAEPAADRAT